MSNLTRIEYDLPAEVYHRMPETSKSDLDVAEVCWAKYNAYKHGLFKFEETRAMKLGTLLHGMVFYQVHDYHSKPDGMNFATKEGKAWRESHADREIVTRLEASELLACARAIETHPHAKMLFQDGKHEVSLFGVHPETGLPIRGRADIMGPMGLGDLKRLRDASTVALSRAIASYRYHVQAAMYVLLAEQNGIEVKGFYFIAIESGDMPLINVRLLKSDAIQQGRMILDRQMRELAECEKTGIWPDYSGRSELPGLIDLPPWSYSDTTGMELVGATDAVESKDEINYDLIP